MVPVRWRKQTSSAGCTKVAAPHLKREEVKLVKKLRFLIYPLLHIESNAFYSEKDPTDFHL